MKYKYEFDFGPNPAFLYDAWFKRKFLPVIALSAVFFPLCVILLDGVPRLVLPSIAAGAIVIFVGVYIHRRILAKRRVWGIKDTIFHYEINETGIDYENELGTGTIKWGFKGKLVPVAKFILLESSELGLLPLPSDTPEDVLEFVRSQIAKK